MPDPATYSAFSADVRLDLQVGDRRLPLAQVGPDRIRLREDCELGPTEATVCVIVDAHEHRRSVFLPEGIRPGDRSVRIVATVPDEPIRSDSPVATA